MSQQFRECDWYRRCRERELLRDPMRAHALAEARARAEQDALSWQTRAVVVLTLRQAAVLLVVLVGLLVGARLNASPWALRRLRRALTHALDGGGHGGGGGGAVIAASASRSREKAV